MSNVVPHHSPLVGENSCSSFVEVKTQVGTMVHHILKEQLRKLYVSEGGLSRFFEMMNSI